jgi:hypothetical protein
MYIYSNGALYHWFMFPFSSYCLQDAGVRDVGVDWNDLDTMTAWFQFSMGSKLVVWWCVVVFPQHGQTKLGRQSTQSRLQTLHKGIN